MEKNPKEKDVASERKNETDKSGKSESRWFFLTFKDLFSKA